MIKKRITEIQESLTKGEAVIISSDSNRLYFTGFRSSAGTVIITPKKSYILIDFRYFEKAKNTINSCEVVLCERLFKQIGDILTEQHIKLVYVETDSLSIERYKAYKSYLNSFEISDSDKFQKIINEQRSIKSQDELKLICKAQALTDETFSYITERIGLGMTEKNIMLEMEFHMRKLGSEGVSFDFIVVSGKNSSLPHGVPTDKAVEKGDFITMDFGAVVEGYHSDMTRTIAVGEVSEKQRLVYNTVLKAQEKAINFITSGVYCCDVDKIARDIITQAGYGKCFGHGLGHSVGIDIHESPACNTSCRTVMRPGIVMTVEPGIYIENEFGVRIEDMVYVTELGCTDITKSKKDLIIL